LRAIVPEVGKDFGECIGTGGAAMLRAFLIRSGVLDALDENLTFAEEAELARVILECRRPSGCGFDFGRLRSYWRAANELVGQDMNSAQLGCWAQGVLAKGLDLA